MGKIFPKISDTLIERLTLLASGAAWFAAGGGPEAMVLMSGAVAGLGATGAETLRQKLADKSPETQQAIKTIRELEFPKFWEEAWGGGDIDPKELDTLNSILSEHIAACWPSGSQTAIMSATSPTLSSHSLMRRLPHMIFLTRKHSPTALPAP